MFVKFHNRIGSIGYVFQVTTYHSGLVNKRKLSEDVREKCNKSLAYYEKLLGNSGQGYFAGKMDFLLNSRHNKDISIEMED